MKTLELQFNLTKLLHRSCLLMLYVSYIKIALSCYKLCSIKWLKSLFLGKDETVKVDSGNLTRKRKQNKLDREKQARSKEIKGTSRFIYLYA